MSKMILGFPSSPMGRLPTMISTEAETSMRVYDLFHLKERKWNSTLVAHLFQLAKRVLSLAISSYGGQDMKV